MKYKNIKNLTEKVLQVKVPQNGVDLNLSLYSSNNGFLKVCENAHFKNGKITTRKGLQTDSSKILDISEFADAMNINYHLSDTVFYKDKKPFQIAYADIEYDSSNRFYQVFLIGSDGYSQNAGYIHFRRVDDTTFFIPENVIFYTGAPQNGGGIFALVELKKLTDETVKESAIYEINETLDSWNKVTEYYIPTVYINGRGNRYDFAKQTGQASTKTPKSLETLNILNGWFYAYYSSDGYSSSFRLPFSDIVDTTVICRIYTALETYTEWRIYEGKTTDTREFYNTEVTMNVNREKGTIFFTVDSGDYPIPLMNVFNENNIRILAKTITQGEVSTITSAKCCAVSGEDIYFSGCSDNNRIYYTSFSNPLYFPQITENFIGSADDSVNALCPIKDSLYVFKQSGIYKVEVKQKNALNSTALLTDNGSVFYGVNSFSVKNISEAFGNIYNNTAGVINGRCIWFDGENIYLLSQSGNEIHNISKEIAPFLEDISENEFKSVFTICKGNFYILSLKGKAVIIEFDSEGLSGKSTGISRYIYKLDNKLQVIGVLKTADDIILCKTAGSDICYTCTVGGNNDTVISKENGQFAAENCDIKSVMKTGNIAIGSPMRKRRIKSILLDIFAEEDVLMKIETPDETFEYTISQNIILQNSGKAVRILTDILCSADLVFSFVSDCGFTLGEINIYYTEF